MTGFSRSAALLPVVWLALTAGVPAPSPGQSVMLPPTAGGWARAESVGVYAGKDLFLLVDGGADLFFEYGFVRAHSAEYLSPTYASATTELYEMSSAEAAFGLFTSFTVGTGGVVPVGQEAVLGDGYCIFWKGTYVVMLAMTEADSASGPELLQLAGGLEREIRHMGALPSLCALLRRGGLDARRMVLVRGKLSLGNQLTHAWALTFPPTDGVVGTSGPCRYLILDYADTAAAGAALSEAAMKWNDMGLSATGDSGGGWTMRERDGRIAAFGTHGRHVLAVVGVHGEAEALRRLLSKILDGS
jgi:hypothetical protein